MKSVRSDGHPGGAAITASRQVFITGGSGYIGRALIASLLNCGHRVRAIVRRGSESKLQPGCDYTVGDPLSADSLRAAIARADTYVQLLGVGHPNPFKGDQFGAVDLRSVQASVAAAGGSSIRHFVYVSVAHPAPIMKDYIEVRREGERLIRASGLNATILRPWYVLGPGHRWPYVLIPVYSIAELLPWMREGARRLGLVTLDQMVRALVVAVENPCTGIRVLEVPDIRNADRLFSETSK